MNPAAGPAGRLILLAALIGGSPSVGRVAIPLDGAIYSLPTPDGAGKTRLLVVIPRHALFQQSDLDSTTLRLTALVRGGGDTETHASWTGRVGRPSPVSEGPFPLDGDVRWVRTMILPPGKVRVSLLVLDLERDMETEAELRGEVPDFAASPLAVSDLVLGRCALEAVDRFDADQTEGGVLPLPRPVYGDRTPEFCASLSVVSQPGLRGEPLRIDWSVRDETGRVIEVGELEPDPAPREISVLIEPTLDRLVTGRHRLRVEVKRGGESHRREAEFDVDASRGARFRDPEQVRVTLGYVATRTERDALERALDRDLPELWERFWERRDPTPDLPENRTMTEFIRRVRATERRYGGLIPGWRTDRGRIHILYGEPDRVEYPRDATYRLPTEVWYYVDRGLEFVFQDVGLGDFRLTGPRRDR